MPSVVGLSQGDGVCVARAAVTTQSLVGALGDVRAAHDDFHPGGPEGVDGGRADLAA